MRFNGKNMFRFKRLFYSLSVCLGIIFIISISSASAFAQTPEMYLQLGYKSGADFQSEQALVFSRDGSLLAAVSGGNAIKIWQTATGREVQTLVGHGELIESLVFLPDNRRIISGGRDKTIRLWDIGSGEQLRLFSGHQDWVRALDVSSDGSFFVSLEGKVVKIWDINTGGLITNIPAPVDAGSTDGYVRPLKYVAFSPDNSKVLFTNLIGDVSIVGISERRIISSISHEKLNYYGWSLRFLGSTGDGRMILGGSSTVFIINDLERLEVTQKVIKDGGDVAYVSIGGSLTAGWDMMTNRINVFDANLKERLSISLGDGSLHRGYSSAKGLVAVGSYGDLLKLYDLTTGKELQNFSAAAFPAFGSKFSVDGAYISLDIQIPAIQKQWNTLTNVWNINTAVRERVFNSTEHSDKISKMFASSNQADHIKASQIMKADSYYKAEAEVWSEYDELNKCFYYVEMASFYGSPLVNIYRLEAKDKYSLSEIFGNREQWKILKQFKAHDQKVTVTSASDKHGYIATGSIDKTIKLFRYPGTNLLRTFKGHLGEIKSLTFSPDGTKLLSQSTDQTTRLWDITTGRELARFIHFTDGEWIVITPEGYFNASPNGAKHLNVRVGNNVYGIDQFYAKFYRPELVQLALAGKEMPKGELITDIAAKKPAPNVQILSPVTNSSVDQDNVAVTLKITDNGGGIGSVSVYLNGAQVANDTRGVIVKGKASANERILSFTIPLIAGQNEIRAVAFNGENSMESNPALINVISNAVMQKPNLYALVIGINTYRNKSISLTYAVPDAIAFAGTLQKIASPLFEKADIRTLITPEATTKEAITKAFEEVRQMVKPNDLFIFYNASHGMVDVVNGEEQYFLLTSNVRLLSSRHISEDALSHKDLVRLIGSIPSQKKLVILDTCNAGKGGKEIQIALLQQTRGLTDATAVKLLQRAVGSSVFSASADTEQALEGYKGHGLFTYVLLEGLQGKADFKKDGFITVKGLDLYTGERVMTLSEEVFRRQQNPMIETGVNDFPIGKVR